MHKSIINLNEIKKEIHSKNLEKFCRKNNCCN